MTVDGIWKGSRQLPGFAASCYKEERGLDLKLSDQQGQQSQPQQGNLQAYVSMVLKIVFSDPRKASVSVYPGLDFFHDQAN